MFAFDDLVIAGGGHLDGCFFANRGIDVIDYCHKVATPYSFGFGNKQRVLRLLNVGNARDCHTRFLVVKSVSEIDRNAKMAYEAIVIVSDVGSGSVSSANEPCPSPRLSPRG